MQQNSQTPNPQSISAALSLARAGAAVPAWPSIRGEDVGRSLAEMAQRDLDAALQLLADRAQFITGASGAAIALRRQGMNDMLCRASAGSNAPELGALLSTEFGLSGESVRTKQVLRCDDAERDVRVNHEVCRQLGIASVVVMPVVHDEEVLGVFELFSGKRNAFGERDLSAVQRLGQMVETAVQLAHVTESLPERLRGEDSPAGDRQSSTVGDQNLDDEILEVEAEEAGAAGKQGTGVPQAGAEVIAAGVESAKSGHQSLSTPASPIAQGTGGEASRNRELETAKPCSGEPVLGPMAPLVSRDVAGDLSAGGLVQDPSKPAKPLLWSAAETVAASEIPGEGDQSHVPPVLRGLRKCEACGFPISGGRVLCVECEEKKWRGQLRRPQPMPTGAIAGSSAAPSSEARAAVAQAQLAPRISSAVAAAPAKKPVPSPAVPESQFSQTRQKAGYPAEPSTNVAAPETEASAAPAAAASLVQNAAPGFAFSSGLADSPSWISANKYVIGALALVVALMVAFLLFR
ncbi:MAG TPA: GAF domain-containing protein [Candidatus Sulfotelmatobacter sp.]